MKFGYLGTLCATRVLRLKPWEETCIPPAAAALRRLRERGGAPAMGPSLRLGALLGAILVVTVAASGSSHTLGPGAAPWRRAESPESHGLIAATVTEASRNLEGIPARDCFVVIKAGPDMDSSPCSAQLPCQLSHP